MDHRIFGKLLYTINNKEQLFLTNSKNLTAHVKGWKYNRPSEENRIKEINEYLNKYGKVEGIIYVAEIIEDKEIKYVCYDGNHRREALVLNDKTYDILVQVMWDVKFEKIKEHFINLNKGNPVPELYLVKDDNLEMEKLKNKIHNVVKKISQTWPKNQSTSKSPKRPNYNRDKLVEQLYNYLTNNNFEYNEEELFTAIIDLNNNYKNGHHINHTKYPGKIIAKCRKTGCYLFLKDFTEDLDFNRNNSRNDTILLNPSE